ncbi:Transcription factor AP-2 [Aphelenchoides besseyi]|nr:Transcription factor AP-2 [Aphelenchoides besseyi]
MNTNVQDINNSADSGVSFNDSGVSSIDKENVTPKRCVPIDDSYDRQSSSALQPIAQSTSHNFNYYPPSFPFMPNFPSGFLENFTFNQLHNQTYPQFQPPLSTQPLANNSLPNFNFPMSSLQTQQFSGQNSTFDSGVYMNSSFNTPPTIHTTEEKKEAEPDVFKIPGRLGLLNENKKYYIKISEIKRRLSEPEKLNISYLNGIIRKAKGQDAGNALKQILSSHGVEIAAGQRINVKPNCFIPLCEQEAMQMADDFKLLSEKFLPTRKIKRQVRRSVRRNLYMYAQIIQQLRQFRGQPDEIASIATQMFKFGCKELMGVFEQDQSLCVQRMPNVKHHKEHMNSQLPKNLQDSLWDFNMATHNFGTSAYKAVFNHPLEQQPC